MASKSISTQGGTKSNEGETIPKTTEVFFSAGGKKISGRLKKNFTQQEERARHYIFPYWGGFSQHTNTWWCNSTHNHKERGERYSKRVYPRKGSDHII